MSHQFHAWAGARCSIISMCSYIDIYSWGEEGKEKLKRPYLHLPMSFLLRARFQMLIDPRVQPALSSANTEIWRGAESTKDRGPLTEDAKLISRYLWRCQWEHRVYHWAQGSHPCPSALIMMRPPYAETQFHSKFPLYIHPAKHDITQLVTRQGLTSSLKNHTHLRVASVPQYDTIGLINSSWFDILCRFRSASYTL